MATRGKTEEPGKVIGLPEGIKIEFRKYTPAMAEAALSKNEVNRSLRPGSVDRYQSDMESDFWKVPDSCIIFDVNGRLINGQHRLTAQARAGATIWWPVMTGVPEDFAAIFDNGAMRSPADALHMMGIGNAPLLSAIASIAVKLERRNFATTKNNVSTSEIIDIVHRSELLKHSAKVASDFRTAGSATPIYPRVIGAAHWWIAQDNELVEADAFMTRIQSCAGERTGSPVLALMRRCNEIKRLQQRVHWRDYFYMVMKAWNADVEGRNVSKIATYSKTGYEILDPLVREIPTVDLEDDDDVETNDPSQIIGEEV